MVSLRAHIPRPRGAVDYSEWVYELNTLEDAVDALLAVKRQTRERDPQMEQVMWIRHSEALARIKRKVTAACF